MGGRILAPGQQLDQHTLQALVHYDPDTGDFTRLVTTSQRSKAGQKCGDVDGKGYLRLCVAGKRYSAHRLAWFYMTGEWPAEELDHINMDRQDNRWENLRLSSSSLNKRNRRAYKNNLVGFKGVSWHVCSRKWRSRIYVCGKERSLGLYDTPEEANEAYRKAAEELFGEHARAA